MKVFPFEDIPAAFRYMRGGNHIGKIVISNGPNAEIQVPVSYEYTPQICITKEPRSDPRRGSSPFDKIDPIL